MIDRCICNMFVNFHHKIVDHIIVDADLALSLAAFLGEFVLNVSMLLLFEDNAMLLRAVTESLGLINDDMVVITAVSIGLSAWRRDLQRTIIVKRLKIF